MQEMEITNIIRQLRVLNAEAKKRYSVADWQSLENKYAYICYSDFDNDATLNSSILHSEGIHLCPPTTDTETKVKIQPKDLRSKAAAAKYNT